MSSKLIEYTSTSDFNLIEVSTQIDWLNWTLIVLCLIFIIISRTSDYSYIPNLFKGNNNFNNNPITLKKLSSLSLLANYYLIISLFIWQYIIITNNNLFDSSILLLVVFVGVIGMSLLKFFIIYMIDFLFKRKNHFHIKLHLSYYQATGIILVPLYILSYYLTPAPYSKIDIALNNEIYKIDVYLIFSIIVLLIILIREIKSLFTALNNRIPLLYIILYLCTLEILPLILVIKILKG